MSFKTPKFSVTAKTVDGSTITLGTPETLSFDSSLLLPYEEMELLVPFQDKKLLTCMVYADDSLFFEGAVEHQKAEGDGDKLLRLSCKSKPGYQMSDNQVVPYAYFRVTADDIFNRYAAPYGIRGVDLDGLDAGTTMGIMLISEKQSCWDCVVQYFVQAYDRVPFVSHDGYIVLTPFTGKTITLSNHSQNGVRFLSAAPSFQNQMVSRVHFYTGEDDFGGLYDESYENETAKYYQCVRELYLNPERSWAANHSRYAKYLFYESMVDASARTVSVPGWLSVFPGDLVVLELDESGLQQLYAGQVSITVTRQEITSVLTLWDKTFSGGFF